MLNKTLNNSRYYFSYIVSFLLVSSIVSNIFTVLFKSILSDAKDLFILSLSLFISFVFIKRYYKPIAVLK